MIIKYGNTDISDLLLEYKRTGSVKSDTPFLLGNAPSIELQLKFDNSSNILQTLDGQIKVYDDENNIKGTYFVYERPERYTRIVTLICYDNMLLLNVPYISNLSYPATIAEQLKEIGTIAGVNIISSPAVVQLLQQQVNFYDNTISCRDYLGWIAEIACSNVLCDESGNITFRTISTTSDYVTEDIESYTDSDLFIIERVCFDNGLLKLEKGVENSNTLYLSSNNPYIDSEHDPTQRILDFYNHLSFNSLESMKAAGLDDLNLFDVIEFNSKKYLVLDFTSTYKGGQFQVQDIKGILQTKNAEKVTIKYDNDIRIKMLKVLVDQNENKMNIIAQEQDAQKSKISQLEVGVNGVSAKVDEKIFDVEQSITESYSSSIEATSKDILLEVNKAIDSNNTDFDNKIASNKVNITNEYTELVKSSVQTVQDIVDGKVSQEQLVEYVRFSGATVEIGKVGEKFRTVITNDKMSFYQSTEEVAYISNNEMYILKARIIQELQVGQYMFKDEGELGFSLMMKEGVTYAV